MSEIHVQTRSVDIDQKSRPPQTVEERHLGPDAQLRWEQEYPELGLNDGIRSVLDAQRELVESARVTDFLNIFIGREMQKADLQRQRTVFIRKMQGTIFDSIPQSSNQLSPLL